MIHVVALPAQSRGQLERQRKDGLQLEGFQVLGHCLLQPSLPPGPRAHDRQDVRVQWVELECSVNRSKPRVRATGHHEQICVPLVRHRVVGVELDRTAELTFRRFPLPIDHQRVCERGVGGTEVGLQCQSTVERLACPRVGFSGRDQAVERQDDMAVGKAGPGLGIRGVELDRPLEELNGLARVGSLYACSRKSVPRGMRRRLRGRASLEWHRGRRG